MRAVHRRTCTRSSAAPRPLTSTPDLCGEQARSDTGVTGRRVVELGIGSGRVTRYIAAPDTLVDIMERQGAIVARRVKPRADGVAIDSGAVHDDTIHHKTGFLINGHVTKLAKMQAGMTNRSGNHAGTHN